MRKNYAVIALIAAAALAASCAAGCGSASSDQTGTVQETETVSEASSCQPLNAIEDYDDFTDCTVYCTFTADDFAEDDGQTALTMTVYDFYLYDMVDVHMLAEGSTITLDDAEGNDLLVNVESVEMGDDGIVHINGGAADGGYDLATSEDTVYYQVDADGQKMFHEIGVYAVPVSADLIVYEKDGENETTTDLAGLEAECADKTIEASETQAVIEAGEIVNICIGYDGTLPEAE